MHPHAQHRFLLVAVAAALAVVLGMAVLWMAPFALGPFTKGDTSAAVSAVVTRSTPCGPNAHDVVNFQLDGKQNQSQVDGCGAQQGATVNIVPPTQGSQFAQYANGQTTVPAGYRRVGFVLLVLAGFGAGALVLWPRMRGGPAAREATG